MNTAASKTSKAGFVTVNLSTGETIETVSYFTPAQTEKLIARADKRSCPIT